MSYSKNQTKFVNDDRDASSVGSRRGGEGYQYEKAHANKPSSSSPSSNAGVVPPVAPKVEEPKEKGGNSVNLSGSFGGNAQGASVKESGNGTGNGHGGDVKCKQNADRKRKSEALEADREKKVSKDQSPPLAPPLVSYPMHAIERPEAMSFCYKGLAVVGHLIDPFLQADIAKMKPSQDYLNSIADPSDLKKGRTPTSTVSTWDLNMKIHYIDKNFNIFCHKWGSETEAVLKWLREIQWLRNEITHEYDSLKRAQRVHSMTAHLILLQSFFCTQLAPAPEDPCEKVYMDVMSRSFFNPRVQLEERVERKAKRQRVIEDIFQQTKEGGERVAKLEERSQESISALKTQLEEQRLINAELREHIFKQDEERKAQEDERKTSENELRQHIFKQEEERKAQEEERKASDMKFHQKLEESQNRIQEMFQNFIKTNTPKLDPILAKPPLKE